MRQTVAASITLGKACSFSTLCEKNLLSKNYAMEKEEVAI